MTNVSVGSRNKGIGIICIAFLFAGISAALFTDSASSQENDAARFGNLGPSPTNSPTPMPSVRFSAIVFFQDETASAFVSVSRVGGHYVGPLQFQISTTDGSATGGVYCGPGIDYLQLDNVPVTLNFGETGKVIEIPLCADGVSEPPETVSLAITGNVSQPTSSSLTISDVPLRFSISGQVLTPDGRGIRNAEVVLLSSVGPHTYARTGSFGWYSFEGLLPGRGYTMNVGSGRFTFQTMQLNVPLLIEDVTDLNFISEPLP